MTGGEAAGSWNAFTRNWQVLPRGERLCFCKMKYPVPELHFQISSYSLSTPLTGSPFTQTLLGDCSEPNPGLGKGFTKMNDTRPLFSGF